MFIWPESQKFLFGTPIATSLSAPGNLLQASLLMGACLDFQSPDSTVRSLPSAALFPVQHKTTFIHAVHLLAPNFVQASATVACLHSVTLLHLLHAITVQSQGAYSIASAVSFCLTDPFFHSPIQAGLGSGLLPII